MAPAKKAPALFAQLQRSLEKEGDELAAKVKVWSVAGSCRLDVVPSSLCSHIIPTAEMPADITTKHITHYRDAHMQGLILFKIDGELHMGPNCMLRSCWLAMCLRPSTCCAMLPPAAPDIHMRQCG